MTTIRLVYQNEDEHNEALRVLLFVGNLVLSPPEGGALPEGVYTVPGEVLRLLDQKQIPYQVLDKKVSLPAYGSAQAQP
jgi:hypothetical protein